MSKTVVLLYTRGDCYEYGTLVDLICMQVTLE